MPALRPAAIPSSANAPSNHHDQGAQELHRASLVVGIPGVESIRTDSLLRTLGPENFRFSILERVSPNMEADKVIALEATWKDRLHTRWPEGLIDN